MTDRDLWRVRVLGKWEQLLRSQDVMPVLAIGMAAGGEAFILGQEDLDRSAVARLLAECAELVLSEGVQEVARTLQ
jgi:hypothetical protein